MKNAKKYDTISDQQVNVDSFDSGWNMITEVQEMEPMYLSIQQKETGKHIKELLSENGFTVREVQRVMGFENPQAIYKWISGKTLPSIDNLVILSRLLHTSIEDILVIDGDIVFWGRFFCHGHRPLP